MIALVVKMSKEMHIVSSEKLTFYILALTHKLGSQQYRTDKFQWKQIKKSDCITMENALKRSRKPRFLMNKKEKEF